MHGPRNPETKDTSMALDDKNLILYVANYTNDTDAQADYQALHDAQKGGDVMVVAAVVISRDDDGEVTVDEHGTGQVAAGAAGGGLVGPWESHEVAVRNAYSNLPPGAPKQLDEEYAARARRVTEEQLMKAGIRLVRILEDAWPEQ
jgi:hypothetical protein